MNTVFGSTPLGLESWLPSVAVSFLTLPIIGMENGWRKRHP